MRQKRRVPAFGSVATDNLRDMLQHKERAASSQRRVQQLEKEVQSLTHQLEEGRAALERAHALSLAAADPILQARVESSQAQSRSEARMA